MGGSRSIAGDRYPAGTSRECLGRGFAAMERGKLFKIGFQAEEHFRERYGIQT